MALCELEGAKGVRLFPVRSGGAGMTGLATMAVLRAGDEVLVADTVPCPFAAFLRQGVEAFRRQGDLLPALRASAEDGSGRRRAGAFEAGLCVGVPQDRSRLRDPGHARDRSAWRARAAWSP